jgi:hypothetical protein
MGSFQKPIDPPKQPCSSVVDCAVTNPDPMALVLLLVAAGVLLLFVAFALAHIKTARSVLEEERERIREEAEAFATFARQVADVEAASRPLADGGPMVRTVRPPSDDGIEAVREAYRDTVMSVPHYDAEYDESLSRNMRLEFGDDVAGAVDRGGTLTPQLKATLVERSRTARDQRVSLLDQLDTEAEALDDADRTLERSRRTADRIADASLDRYAFDELAAEWRLLEDRREAADSLLTERQEAVQERDRENGTRRRGPTFEEYLYGPMDVTHPVLAAGTSVLDRREEARRQVASALARRT